MYRRYLKVGHKPQADAIKVRRFDTGDLMAIMLLFLLLADGNEDSESVITTLLIFLLL